MDKFLYFLLFCFAAVLTSCSPAPNDGEVTVAQWGTEKYLIYLPLYVAQENGYFSERGLQVEVEYSGNDDQVFAKVLRGDAQFGVGDPIFAAVSRQQGADGVVLASVVDRVALWGVSRSSKVIERPSDFSGLRIATFPRPSTNYTLMSNTLSEPGIDGAAVVEVPIGNELAALESGSADVAMMLEPATSIAESEGYHVVTSFPDLWGPFAFTGLTSTQEIVEANPDTAQAMIEALQESVEYIYESPEGAIDIAAALFPNLDKSVVASAVRRMIEAETIPVTVDVTRESWIKSIRTRQEVGDIEEGFDCLECLVSIPD